MIGKDGYIMEKELFVNVGRDIKAVARSIANWILALYVLVGFVLVACGVALLCERMWYGVIGIFLAVGVVGFGYTKSKLEVMRLYAYGEIADRIISIDQTLSQKQGKPQPGSVKVNPQKKEEGKKPARKTAWECSFCGHGNPPDARFCESCGTEDVEF